MDAEAVFNRYDVRGDYPAEIDEEFAERFGKAVGTYAQRNRHGMVVVGRDDRDSSEQVYDPFIAGIRATGADVIDAGIGTTDRTALAVTHYGGIGVMVTASHHAWKRTGFKCLYEQGHGFANADLVDVKDLFTEEDFEDGEDDEGTLIRVQHEFDEHYIEAVKEHVADYVTEFNGTVVLDAVAGADRTASVIFEDLGFDVIAVERDEQPSPEPIEADRTVVKQLLEQEEADIAVGYDPDGDRVYVIHPELGWIDGNALFYLLGRITEPEVIVASVDTSPMIEELDADIGYTRVGDVFVAERGVEWDADLLGEPNGHYAVTDFCWYNSGIFASMLLAARHDQLEGLLAPVQDWDTYRTVEVFASMDERDAAMNTVMKHVAQYYEVIDTTDGVKFTDDEITALARPSGTSPKIRLTVHGKGDIKAAGTDVAETIFRDE